MTHDDRQRDVPGARSSHALSVVGVFVVGIVGSGWLTRWLAGMDVFYGLLLPGYVAVTLIHEFGHALAGLLSDFRVPFLYMGPLRVEWPKAGGMRIEPNRRLGLWGGAVLVLPRSHPGSDGLETFRRRMIAVFAAGPGASVLAGVIGLLVSLFFAGSFPVPPGQGLSWLQLLSLMSLAIGLGQLVPIRIGNQRSDGLRVLSLLRGRRGTDQTLLDAMIVANADGVRPYDWPLPEPDRFDAITDLTTLMLMYYALLDRGRHADARSVLDRPADGGRGRSADAWRAVREIERSYMRTVYFKDDAPAAAPPDIPPSHRHISELSLARARAALMVARGEVDEAIRCADSVRHLRSLPSSSGLTQFNLSELDKILGAVDVPRGDGRDRPVGPKP